MKYHPVKVLFLFITIIAVSSAFTKNSNIKPSNPVKPDSLKVYKDPQITAFFKRETGWIAADGALSVQLENKKVLWLFGDTFTKDYNAATGTVPCLFNVRSCALLQPWNNWDWHQTETILNPEKKSLFINSSDPKHFNWPAAGFNIKDTVYVYCLSLKNTGAGGMMGFAADGHNVFAKMTLSDMKVAGYHELQDLDGINFGIAFIKNADGYVYAYGERGKAFAQSYLYLARFPASNPNAKWTFWDGTGWNSDVKKVKEVGRPGAVSPNVAKVKNKYLLFTSDFSLGCDQGKKIYVQVSNKLTGPFSDKKLVYTIDDTVKGHYPFFYLPIAHPEYINDKDELLVTYSINGYGSCVPGCVNGKYNPDFYRPRGIRVPLKLIDPTL